MKKRLITLILPLTLVCSSAIAADIKKGITIFTTSNWSNMQIVKPTNPAIVCTETGKMPSGTTVALSKDELSTDKYTQCNVNNQFGVIFYGNYSNSAYPPKLVKDGKICTASYKFSDGLVFDCQNM